MPQVTLTYYWPLIFLLLIPFHYLASRYSMTDLGTWRKWIALVVRSLLILLIVLALCGLRVIWPVKEQCLIYALDHSYSISNEETERALGIINKLTELKETRDKVGMVVFGNEAHVEFSPQLKPNFHQIDSKVNRGYTDIAAAIRLASAIFPAEYGKHLVVLSDGNNNKEPFKDEVALARNQDVSISVVPLHNKEMPEVLVDKVMLPSTVKKNEPFQLKISLRSNYDGPIDLTISREEQFLGRQSLPVVAGEKNVFLFNQILADEGFVTYRVSIETPKDQILENNINEAFTFIEGDPRVLVVRQKTNHDPNLFNAIRAGNINYEKVSPFAFPGRLEDLSEFDAVILDNISALDLTTWQLNMLKVYVSDLGGGVFCIGGDDSYGVGGYFKTPLEELLPVTMDVKQKLHLPAAGLVICIDKSGSMGGMPGTGANKIELAKEGAMAALELLTERDYYGVLAFDGASKVIVPFNKVSLQADAYYEIAKLRAGGGTNLFPALRQAIRWLSESKAAVKHIIVLSDGVTQPADFDRLMNEALTRKITVTSVAVGPDSDFVFMQELATRTNGRYYSVNEIQHLPRIFTKETLLAARSALVEKAFQPLLKSPSPVLDGLPTGNLPLLHGYIATTEKSLATVALISDDEDPILAHWQYGLGRAIALTTDARARWAKNWVLTPYFPKLINQSIRWCLKRTSSEHFTSSVQVDSGKGRLFVEALDDEGNFMNFLKLSARVISPTFDKKTVHLKQTAPGRYEGEFESDESGVYLYSIIQQGEEQQILDTSIGGYVSSYSPEFRSLSTNHHVQEYLANIGDGMLLASIGDVFPLPRKIQKVSKDIWETLIWYAIFLILLDVALRRLAFSRADLATLWQRIGSRKRVAEEEEALVLQRLRKAKSDLRAADEEKEAIQVKLKGIKDRQTEDGITERPVAKKPGDKEKPTKKATIDEDQDSTLNRLKKVKKDTSNK